eukprot:TRINITY_DN45164_c0_g1_i1.p1 TRINITY_DN45164_c0_g1~~TRINITY_DN45164_c0_g1_i1.p1  ORF type:complete len:400 (-),score=83.19 TRINITY_DN45164_c0_g1_i1:317-1516(-)
MMNFAAMVGGPHKVVSKADKQAPTASTDLPTMDLSADDSLWNRSQQELELEQAADDLDSHLSDVFGDLLSETAERYDVKEQGLKKHFRRTVKEAKNTPFLLAESCKLHACTGGSSPSSSSISSSDAAEQDAVNLISLEAQVERLQKEKDSLAREAARLQVQLDKKGAASGERHVLRNLLDKVTCVRRPPRLQLGKFQSAPVKASRREDFSEVRRLSTNGSSRADVARGLAERRAAWGTACAVPNCRAFLCDLDTLDIMNVTESAAGMVRLPRDELLGENFLALLAQPEQGRGLRHSIRAYHSLAMAAKDAPTTNTPSTLGTFPFRRSGAPLVYCDITLSYLPAVTPKNLASAVIVFLHPELPDADCGDDMKDDDVKSEASTASIGPLDSVSNIGLLRQW